MQQTCAALVLVSVGSRKEPVRTLALSLLPFASQNSGEAIGSRGLSLGGGDVEMSANEVDFVH